MPRGTCVGTTDDIHGRHDGTTRGTACNLRRCRRKRLELSQPVHWRLTAALVMAAWRLKLKLELKLELKLDWLILHVTWLKRVFRLEFLRLPLRW